MVFHKAFNLVDRNILLEKLHHKSVPTLLCKWFELFLSQWHQHIRVRGFPCSQWLFLNGGMQQGSLLGAISFIIHMDNLSLLCNVLKYVDETTVSKIIGSNSSVSVANVLLTLMFDNRNKCRCRYLLDFNKVIAYLYQICNPF